MTSAGINKESKRKPTIYIVDDDDGMRRALGVLMTTVVYNATAFARPTEFLAKYDANQPGCLVLDVRMPEMSGLEGCFLIRWMDGKPDHWAAQSLKDLASPARCFQGRKNLEKDPDH